jgi:oligopeptide/dipeptide ABC transporter ATP-binding protein
VAYGGQLREYGTTDDVVADPRDPYTQRLLASLPSLHGDGMPTFLPGTPPDLRQPPDGCRFLPRCPVAFEQCVQPPPFREVAPGHSTRCWLSHP